MIKITKDQVNLILQATNVERCECERRETMLGQLGKAGLDERKMLVARMSEIDALETILKRIDFCHYCGDGADTGKGGENIEAMSNEGWGPREWPLEGEETLYCPKCVKAGKVVFCEDCNGDIAADSSDLGMAWKRIGKDSYGRDCYLCPGCQDEKRTCAICRQRVPDAEPFILRGDLTMGGGGKCPWTCYPCSRIVIATTDGCPPCPLVTFDFEPEDLKRIAALPIGGSLTVHGGASGDTVVIRCQDEK